MDGVVTNRGLSAWYAMLRSACRCVTGIGVVVCGAVGGGTRPVDGAAMPHPVAVASTQHIDPRRSESHAWSPKQRFMARELIEFHLSEQAARKSAPEAASPLEDLEELMFAVSRAENVSPSKLLQVRDRLFGDDGAFGDAPNDVINDLIAAGASHEWSEAAFNRWKKRLKDFACNTKRPELTNIVDGRLWCTEQHAAVKKADGTEVQTPAVDQSAQQPAAQHGPVEWVRSVLDESWNELKDLFSQ